MGNARSLLIIGAQVALTPVFISKFIHSKTARVVLISTTDAPSTPTNSGPKLQQLTEVVSHIQGQGVTNLEVRTYESGNTAELEQQISDSFNSGDIDLAIVTITSQYATARLAGKEVPFDSLSLTKATSIFTEGLVALRQVAQNLATQGSGHFVTITDAEPLKSRPSAVAASTVGLDSYAKALSREVKPYGVRMIRVRVFNEGSLQKSTQPPSLAIAISDALIKKRKHTIRAIT